MPGPRPFFFEALIQVKSLILPFLTFKCLDRALKAIECNINVIKRLTLIKVSCLYDLGINMSPRLHFEAWSRLKH